MLALLNARHSAEQKQCVNKPNATHLYSQILNNMYYIQYTVYYSQFTPL